MRLPDRQRSRAVLIGTGKYADDKLPDLPVVGRTIGDLAAALTDPVYGVVPENHCTVLEDQADIRLIGRHLRSAASLAEDLLLVYFVGHGLVGARRHELYLGLPDSEWAEPEFNSLEYDKLRSAVLDSAAATKIIILDCCFSGRVVSEAMADPVTELVGQIEVDGTYVLASAGRDQVALIRPGEDHTAFTGRLLHLLRNGVPGGPELLTVDYLYRQLVMRMKAEGLSQPQKRGTSTADLLALAGNRAFAAACRHLQEATGTIADTPTPAVRLDPGNADYRYALAGRLDDAGKVAEAEAEYREAARLDPGNADYRYALAGRLDDAGKVAEAEAEYREAARLDPGNADYRYALAGRLDDAGKVAEAEAEYREAARLDPGNADYRYALGLLLREAGKVAEAEAEYREAVRLDPGNADYRYALGLLLREAGKVAEAEAEYREAVRLDPGNRDYRYALGLLLREAKRLPGAGAPERPGR